MKKHQGNREKPPGKKPGPAKRTLSTQKRKSPRKKSDPIPDPTVSKPEVFLADNAEALVPVVRRALELQGLRFHLWEIAEVLEKEFNLAKAPSEATVWRWCEEARSAYMADIKALTAREIAQQLQTCDAMLRTWLPRAMDGMSVSRGRMRDGEYVEIIDENAIAEKVKAAGVVAKYLEMRGNLLGIDKGMGLPKEGGERTADQLHAFLLSLATQAVAHLPMAQGKTIEAKPALTLESGVEDLSQ